MTAREPGAGGWQRRFIAAPARLDEIRQLYEGLGFDVRLDPLSESDLAQECGDCRLAMAFFRTVFTRSARIRP